MALRGRSAFAAFAPKKAQRILADSLAYELWSKGAHVAYLVIDAVIDVPWQRKRPSDARDDFFISPASIAGEAFPPCASAEGRLVVPSPRCVPFTNRVEPHESN